MKNKPKTGYDNHGNFFGWGSSPDADWRVMFSIFLILICGVGVVALSTFSRMKSGVADNGSSENRPIDRELLHKTAAFYEAQKLNFAKYQSLPETTPDPSL